MQKVTLKVVGMARGGCKRAVTRALSDLDGVEAVEIDLAAREAKVQYDANKVSLEAMGNAIRDAGYDVKG